MTDPILDRFARACGARQPLVLCIHLSGGEKLAEGEVESPFVLVGRDDACDVTLTDPEVDPRHLWLQVLGGHLYAVDLGSRAGLVWSDGRRGSGWLRKDRALSVGPFVLILQRPPAEASAVEPLSEQYQPLQSDASLAGRFPPTVLEFRNGKRARDRWQVNRRLTLIGRAPECKIRLSAEDITRYHCGLVYTPQGLWIVDLSGHGVVVNGERMRVAPLDDGADLWVGRFRLGVHVGSKAGLVSTAAVEPSPKSTPPSKESASRGFPSDEGDPRRGTPAAPPPPHLTADDEVPLGDLPSPGSHSATGLSNSHIMADVFAPAGGGEISQSILIAQSGSLTPPPQPHPSEAAAVLEELSATLPTPAAVLPSPGVATTPETREESRLTMVLREVGQLHRQMAALLQQSCALLADVGQYLQPARQAELEETLGALRRISESLQSVEWELSRLASETPREIRHPSPRVRPPSPPPASMFSAPPGPASPSGATSDPPDPPPDSTEESIMPTLPHARLEPRSKSRHNTAG
jgi:pSer/pThr/pTyr-binding forkhead associated (FHA) protein